MKIHHSDENSSLGFKFIGLTKFIGVTPKSPPLQKACSQKGLSLEGLVPVHTPQMRRKKNYGDEMGSAAYLTFLRHMGSPLGV